MRLRSCFVGLFALALAAMAGCKQGEGERCQINSDCEDGLTCVREGDRFVCRSGGGGGIDAGLTPDAAAPAIDAAVPDAAAPDAAPIDAP